MIVSEINTVSFKVDWEALAKVVKDQILFRMQEDLKTWVADVEMCAMVARDAADGLQVCEYLYNGNLASANEKLRYMDTSPREWVLDFIEEAAGNNKNFMNEFFR